MTLRAALTLHSKRKITILSIGPYTLLEQESKIVKSGMPCNRISEARGGRCVQPNSTESMRDSTWMLGACWWYRSRECRRALAGEKTKRFNTSGFGFALVATHCTDRPAAMIYCAKSTLPHQRDRIWECRTYFRLTLSPQPFLRPLASGTQRQVDLWEDSRSSAHTSSSACDEKSRDVQ